jgi:hypothetical protein
MRGMIEQSVASLTRCRRGVVSIAVALAASLGMLAAAPPAPASFQHEFAPFAKCPVNTPGVSECLVSTVTSGEFKIGSNTVPIDKPIVLQGGYNPKTHELVGATDGNTLSKTPLKIPGGLLGIELLGNLTEVTATAELAGPAHLDLKNLGGAGPLVNLPLKVKLDNPLLGSECFIGSSSEPVTLNLTDGTTSPPPPNEPISGKFGKAIIKDEGRILGATENTLVDNAFSAPGVNGCGGILSLVVDLSVDLKAGLPAAAGTNTAIMNGMLEQAEARIVKTEQEIPLLGRCAKVEGVKEGKTVTYGGKYSSSNCVTEAVESLKPGKYEWSIGPGPKRKFTGSIGVTTLETVGKTKVTCTSGSSQGEYTGVKTETATFAFTGCESAAVPCQSPSASPGEIRTSSLSGTLGFIKDTEPLKPLVGFDYQPATSGAHVMTFKCGALEQTVDGSVIGAVTALNKTTAKSTLTFKAAKGVQSPEAFEEEPKDVLSATLTTGSGSSVEQSGLKDKAAIVSEEPIEVKARAY